MKRSLLLAACLGWVLIAQAQTVEPAIFQGLQKARAAQERGDYQQAAQLLDALKPKQGSFAAVLVTRNRAYLAWQAGQPGRAIELLQSIQGSTHLSAEDQREDRLNLARLLVQQKQYTAAVKFLQGQPETDEVLQLGIQAWQAQGRYDQALPLAERFLGRQKTIEPQWLQFMVAAHSDLKQFGKAVSWQQRFLRQHENSLEQWQRLAALQQRAGDLPAAFATLRSAYSKGLNMQAEQLQQLLQLSVAAGQPWQGARLLEQMLAQGQLENTMGQRELLASLYWQAREHRKALDAYAALASAGYKSADNWLMVAQLALRLKDWNQVEQALVSAEHAGAAASKVQTWRDWLESSRPQTVQATVVNSTGAS